MSDRTHRRTVLGTLAALALAPMAASADGTGRGPPDRDSSRDGGARLPPGGAAGPALANRSDTAIGVVDRIVDGRFVVILVEEEGEVVDQIVLDIDDPILPEVAEGDVLLLAFDDEGELVDVKRLDGETERAAPTEPGPVRRGRRAPRRSGWSPDGMSVRQESLTDRTRPGPSRPSRPPPGGSGRTRPR